MYQLSFLVLISSIISVGAFVFTNILTQPDHLLSGVESWLQDHLPEYLYKPLIGCQHCVAGQWALWYYLVICFVSKENHYRVDVHILFVLLTIYFEEYVTYFYYKIYKS